MRLPLNQILHGDCLELFKKIPNNSIDCAFADPPFNLKKKYNSHKNGTSRPPLSLKLKSQLSITQFFTFFP